MKTPRNFSALGRLVVFIVLFFGVASNAAAQSFNYTLGNLSVDIDVFNPCQATPNGAIRFTVNTTEGGANAQIVVLGLAGAPSLFPPQIVAPGNSFTFNPSTTLPAGTYDWIIGDGTNIIGSSVDIITYPRLVLTTITAPSITKDTETNNTSCVVPNGQVQASITGGSKALPGGGSFNYSWSSSNGTPTATGTTDGNTPLNLATLLGLPGLRGGTYTLVVDDDFSLSCTATSVFTITDPSPTIFNVTTPSPLSVCSGDNINLTMNNSEVGVTYEILLNGFSLPTPITFPGLGAGVFNMTFPSTQFSNGTILVQATNGFCTPQLMNNPVSLIIRPLPTVSSVTGGGTICSGDPLPNVTFNFTGTAPFNFTYTNGVTPVTVNNHPTSSFTITNAAAGTYSVTALSDANGCVATNLGGSVSVIVNPSPSSAVLSGSGSVCLGSSTNLVVTITGGTSPYTITIDNGVGTINNYVSGTPIPVSPAATTTYNMVGNVVDANGCSVAGSGSATVTINTPPTSAVLSGAATICSGTSTNLSVAITGGTSPYTITINNGVGTINNYVSGTPIPVSPGATTTYNMVGNVVDANGCTVAGTGSAIVTVNPSPTSAVLSGSTTLCSGGSANLVVNITSGTGPFSITIDNGVGTINNYVSGTPIPVSPATTTTYNMVGNVTDVNGCFVAGSGSATITVNAGPTSAVLTGNATICSGTSTNLVVTITGGTSPYTLTINNGVGTINNYVSGTPIPVSPAVTTGYTIVGNVTDANGCSVAGTGSATVIVNQGPTSAVLSGTNTLCSGGSANLVVTITGGTSPYTITIDNGVGTINNYVSGTPIPVSPVATTTYNMVGNVTDANGCSVAGSGSATITINNPPTSAVLSGTATICSGSSTNLVVTITGGASPYTININNGVGTINNYVSGTPIPVSPAATTAYALVGNVVDANGCSVAGTGTATVTVNPSPTSAVLSGTATICNGASTNLIVTITSGTGPFTITIDNGVGTINNYVSGTPIPVNPAATTTYNMVGNVTDVNGCFVAGTGSATVTVNSGPTSAALSGTATICSGTSTNLVVTIAGGTGPYTVTIDNGVGTINNYVSGTPIPVSPAATTTYSIVGNVTDANGCGVAGSGGAVVTVNPSPTSAILSGSAALCAGGSANLVVTITSGTGPFTITIDNGVGTINNYVSGTPIPVSPAATTTYSMVGNVTDASGCFVAGTGSATITINNPPTSAVLSGTATICSGTSTNLSVAIAGGAGPYTITIDNGVGTINNYVSGTPIPVSPAATTTYSLVGNVVDANGCTVAGTGGATVTVNNGPTSAVLSGNATICSGTSTNISVAITGGVGPYTVTINNGVGTINNYVSGTPIPVSPTATTTYSIVGDVTDANGCGVAGTGSAVITVNPSPTATISGTASICAGSSTNLTVTFTGTSPWSFVITDGVTPSPSIPSFFNSITFPVNPTATTTYTLVSVSDASGCPGIVNGSAVVTVNQPPATGLTVGVTIDPVCTGGTSGVTVAASEVGVSYQLRNDVGDVPVGSPVVGTGGTITLSTGPLSATTTFNILATAGGCASAELTATATVNVAGSINAGLTVTAAASPICEGTSTDIQIAASENGVLYQLRNDFDDSAVGAAVAGTGGTILLPTGNLTATTSFNVLASNGTCSVELLDIETVNVDVAPDPSLVVGVTIDPLCSGGISGVTVALSEVGVNYQLRNDIGDVNVGSPVAGTGGTITLSTGALTTTTTFNVLASGLGACPPVELTTLATVNVSGTVNAGLTVTAAASPICEGTSTDIQVAASEVGVTYQLRNDLDDSSIGAAVAGTGGTILLPTGNLTASTTFNVLASNGTCSIELTDTETVNVDIAPDASLVVDATIDPLCVGGTSAITVAASEVGVTYQLRNDFDDSLIGTAVAGTGATISLSTGPLAATTTFNVLASSGGACPDVELATLVTVNVAGSIDNTLAVTSSASPICANTSTFIQVAASEIGVSYQLRNDATDTNVGSPVAGTGGGISLPTGNLTATTTFNVLASNATCSIELTDTEQVVVNPAPNPGLAVTASQGLICSGTGTTIIVTASEAGVTYQLRNSAGNVPVGAPIVSTGGNISFATGPLTANTTFNVLATVGTCSVQLTSTASVAIRSVGDPACTGGGSNCFVFTVNIDPIQTIRPSCANQDDGRIVMAVSGLTGGNYIIKLISPSNTFTQIGPAGTYTFNNLSAALYEYRIEDALGNFCQQPYNLPLQTVVTASAANFVNAQCFGQPTGQATVTVTGGNSPYQYSIDGSKWTDFVSGAVLDDLPPNGTYNILVRDDATDGCPAEVSVTIDSDTPAITATFQTTSANCGTSDGSIFNIVASGGAGGPFEFSIDDGVTFTTDDFFDNLPGGIDTLVVRDVTSGCTQELPYSITFPGFVNFTVTPGSATCTNNGVSGTLTVRFTDAGTYEVGISADPLVEPTKYVTYTTLDPINDIPLVLDSLTRGVYYVFAKTTAALCPTRQGAFVIDGVYALTFDVQPVCDGNVVSWSLINITGEPGTPFQLRIFRKFTSTAVVDEAFVLGTIPVYTLDYNTYLFLQTPGDYVIQLSQVQQSILCEVFSDDVDYTVTRPLFAQIGQTRESYPDILNGFMEVINFDGGTIPYSVRIELDSAAVGGQVYETDWEEVARNSNLQFEKEYENVPAGRYRVEVIDSVGCFIELVARVPLDTDIYVPNIFTPNEDGFNDSFFIRNLPATGANLVVSDRWGKQVYKSESYQNNWDGEEVSDGIYFYRLKVSEKEPITGWVEVLRGNKP